MTRIEPLGVEEAKAAAGEDATLAYMTRFNVFRVLLRHPKVAKAMNDMLMALLVEPKLDPRLRELIIMRIGWTTASDYEWTQHWNVSVGLGIPSEDLDAVKDWRASDRFSASDRAVLAAVDETLEAGRISEGTWSALRAHVGGDEELIEVCAAIGNWRTFSSVLRSLEVALEDGIESWPPHGIAPA